MAASALDERISDVSTTTIIASRIRNSVIDSCWILVIAVAVVASNPGRYRASMYVYYSYHRL